MKLYKLYAMIGRRSLVCMSPTTRIRLAKRLAELTVYESIPNRRIQSATLLPCFAKTEKICYRINKFRLQSKPTVLPNFVKKKTKFATVLSSFAKQNKKRKKEKLPSHLVQQAHAGGGAEVDGGVEEGVAVADLLADALDARQQGVADGGAVRRPRDARLDLAGGHLSHDARAAVLVALPPVQRHLGVRGAGVHHNSILDIKEAQIKQNS